MKLYKKFLKKIENGEPIYDNVKFAKDLEAIANKHFKQLPMPVVGRWRFLIDRSDFEEMPKKGNFRCLFDDGSVCNYFDEHPIAIMVAWRPL